MLSWRSFPGNKSPNIYRLRPVLYRRFTTEVGDTPRYILASTIPRSARDSQRIAFRERVGDIPRCEMHRGSIISVPTVRHIGVIPVACHPSISVERTVKRGSRGANLIYLSQVPSGSPSTCPPPFAGSYIHRGYTGCQRRKPREGAATFLPEPSPRVFALLKLWLRISGWIVSFVLHFDRRISQI